jgi:hypothetical protein
MKYADIPEPFLDNGSINTFPQQQITTEQWCSNRGTVVSVWSVPRGYKRDEV